MRRTTGCADAGTTAASKEKLLRQTSEQSEVEATMNEYRTSAALAAIAFLASAFAGLAYGASNGTFFVGTPALAGASLVWATLWIAAAREEGSPARLAGRIRLARLSGMLGVTVAVVLAVSAAL